MAPQSLFLLLIIVVSSSSSALAFRPKALVLPVKKDASTLQYVTRIRQRTLSLVLDLGAGFLWVDCDHYVSSTYRSPRCRSSQCYLAVGAHGCGDCYDAPKPGCNNHTCLNTLTRTSSPGEITSDVVNGGSDPTTAVVMGGHQLENILLQFDLASSKLGFSSTLLGRQTSCANFNFTSTA